MAGPRDDDGNHPPARRDERTVTILGFGSLLSAKSARLTFPDLENFRLGRVPDHRRVFAHPASIFFERGIANIDTLEMSSLSCEYEEGRSFVCSAFDVPRDAGRSRPEADAPPGGGGGGFAGTAAGSDWIPSQAFLEREEEFEIALVPYVELTPSHADDDDDAAVAVGTGTSPRDDGNRTTTATGGVVGVGVVDFAPVKMGVICRRSTDEAYVSLWGRDRFEGRYLKYGVEAIWGWSRDSGLRPCPAYLRHCVLASWNFGGGGRENDRWSDIDGAGGVCYDSFLDETYLVDRETTVREYLTKYPGIMKAEPPEELRERYGG